MPQPRRRRTIQPHTGSPPPGPAGGRAGRRRGGIATCVPSRRAFARTYPAVSRRGGETGSRAIRSSMPLSRMRTSPIDDPK
ncbi:hypothetical protein, partial [Methanoculleus chikugoensis]|uniref:hypothetical protein n=1 Tax=Methanoculleus chikugoensis TaxID=118126 RepID=UPI001FB1C832